MKCKWDFSEFYEFADKLEKADLTNTFTRIAKELSKALLKHMKNFTPVDEYELMNGWNGNQFAVKQTEKGYEVLIVNKTPYALAVNDGHKSYNQYGGAYKIKRRIQVRSPHKWQKGSKEWYVFGHFFVERGILQMTNTQEMEAIILRELTKWWDSL